MSTTTKSMERRADRGSDVFLECSISARERWIVRKVEQALARLAHGDSRFRDSAEVFADLEEFAASTQGIEAFGAVRGPPGT